MVSYMHEDDKIHPAMIVVPGGGYRQVSRTEAHLVAMDFYEADYNVFVLVYTVNPLDEVPLEMQPLQDISRAIRMIRGKAEENRKEDGLDEKGVFHKSVTILFRGLFCQVGEPG